MTYIEVTVAAVLLAVCIAPALQAIRSGLGQQAAIRSSSLDQECVQQALEKTLSEPYGNLLASAVSTSPSPGKFAGPTSYSLGPDAQCPSQRNVYILRYNPALSNPFASTSDDMLYVRAHIPNAMSHGTLAIRK